MTHLDQPSKRTIRVAIGSTCSLPGQWQYNIQQIAELAQKAQVNACHLLLTPEMSATGYGGYDEVVAIAEPQGRGPIFSALQQIAMTTNVVICAGYVERVAERQHIAHYAVFPDGSYVSQRKHRATPVEFPLQPGVPLFDDGQDEIGQVRQSDVHFELFRIHGVSCAIVICADLGIPQLPQHLHQLGVEMMLLPVGAGGKREERISLDELATAQGLDKYQQLLKHSALPQQGAIECIQYHRATVAVNMHGYDGQRHYHGGSGSIVSAKGQIVAYTPGTPIIELQKPEFVYADLKFT
jgi:predicted amidohydrolase